MKDRFREVVDSSLDITITQRGEAIRQDKGNPRANSTRYDIQKKLYR